VKAAPGTDAWEEVSHKIGFKVTVHRETAGHAGNRTPTNPITVDFVSYGATAIVLVKSTGK
jgi:hypothetical protein